MTKHVISTLAATTRYTGWVHQAGINTVEKFVEVRGGAGVALQTAGQLNAGTPGAFRTEITDEDAVWLAKNKQFQDHVKRGFVCIVDKPVDPEKAAESMATDDGSRPKTTADVKKDAADAAAKAGLQPDEALQAVTNKPGSKK